MEQAAAFNTHEEALVGSAAQLRLRQGSSTRATWILEESPGGTMITVGSDPSCDWQIRAAFVPPRAFSVLLLGGIAYVRPGQDMGVLLNGRPLDGGWTPAEQGARVDVGLARLEVVTAPSSVIDYGSSAGRGLDSMRELDSGTYPTGAASQADAAFPLHDDREGVPAVFEDDERRDRSSLWRYAVAGVATACAYGGWVFLLDYL
jgi:predicted component of type VI protein secretion system